MIRPTALLARLDEATRLVPPDAAGALARRWAELPESVRTPAQLLGRRTTGCEGTHGVFPRCNFGCRPCYHSSDANRVRVDGPVNPLAFPVIVDVDEQFSGVVVQGLAARKGVLKEMRPSGGGRQRLVFIVPTRGLIGYQGDLMTDTRGTAVMNRLFHEYVPYKGELAGRRNGVLVSNGMGETTAYALYYLQDRGLLMLDPQTKVYEGMIVGQHTRDNDLVVNIIQGKKLTNMRASGKDENIIISPHREMGLEAGLEWIAEDELVEVTPQSIRLRKKILKQTDRPRRRHEQEE